MDQMVKTTETESLSVQFSKVEHFFHKYIGMLKKFPSVLTFEWETIERYLDIFIDMEFWESKAKTTDFIFHEILSHKTPVIIPANIFSQNLYYCVFNNLDS